MRYLIAVIAISTLALAGIEAGLSWGFHDANPEPVPVLSLGLSAGDLYSLSLHGAAVGFNDRWETVGFAGAGFGPVRLGVCYGDTWGSYVGFEVPVSASAQLVTRALNVEGEEPIISTGMSLTL